MAKQPSRRPSKIRPVPIAQMRVPTALVTQREFRKAHGDRIASELDLNKLGFPVINHRDGIYWVVDGQHRIYALKQNGFEKDVLDCEVYEDLTDAETADIFLGRDDRKPIPLYDKFHVSCTAGHRRERDIQRAIESNGQKISRTKDGGISAVGALGAVYDRAGDVVLGQVIRTINLGFGGDPMAFDRAVIEGLGLIYNRYNGRTNEKELGARLATLRQGARELLRKAEAIRERTGNQKKQCVAAAVVDLYNRGEGPRSKDRLPSWWKEAE
jgi:uncharacterized protein DUF6551